jgi:hypothetical protein
MRTFSVLLSLPLLFALACGGDRPGPVTLDDWRALNPSLEHYGPLHEDWAPQMGIHWGAPGPHLTLGVAHDDVVAVVELIVPAAVGWQPWFDQAEDSPMEIPGLGEVYTQHVWITERETVVEGERPKLLPLTLDALEAENPALAQYDRISDYVPGMGFHYAPLGPSVVLAVGHEGEITAFELISPAEQGWFPWFDQPEDSPMEIPGLGEVYTQHLWVVDPASLE